MLLPLSLLSLALSARASCPMSGPTERRIVACREGLEFAECRRAVAEAGCAVVREFASIGALVLEVPAEEAAFQEKRLTAMIEVETVEADPRRRWIRELPAFRAEVPALAVPADAVPWGVEKVGAPRAWGRARGARVKLAVIDTGIDPKHLDLAQNLAGGWNALDPKSPEAWADDEGHGTHVAGIAAAAANRAGVVGVAPEARLYAVKVLDAEGNGSLDDIIAGLEWVALNGMDVANISLGAPEGSVALRRMAAFAYSKGVTLVAAAGNDQGPVNFPAAYPELLAVSASNRSDMLAGFSSRGPEVDFIAPGTGIVSDKLGGGTVEHDGTSMASPHVAGLAALAVSLGARGPAQVRAMLEAAARRLPGVSPSAQGRGLISAERLGAHLAARNAAAARDAAAISTAARR